VFGIVFLPFIVVLKPFIVVLKPFFCFILLGVELVFTWLCCLNAQVQYSWAMSVIIRHRLQHSYAGNGTSGNLSRDLLNTMYDMLAVERREGVHGSIKRTVFRLEAAGTPVGRLTVSKWAKTWSRNGDWKFKFEHQPRVGRPMKLSAAGITSAAAALLGSRAREVSRKRTFEAMNGGTVAVSRQTITAIGVRAGHLISVPKRVRIRVHFSHHRVFRVSHCKAALTKDKVFRSGLWYSDEQS